MPPVVRRLDRRDDADLRALWEVGHASSAEQPFAHWPAWDFARRSWAQDNPTRETVLLGAEIDGRCVGGAILGMSLADNAHLAAFDLHVEPGARRRGVGAALLAAVQDEVVSRARTTWVSSVVVPVGGEAAGLAFGAAHGYDPVSTEECKVVDLAEHQESLAGLERVAAERAHGHALAAWEDPTPQEHADDVCALYSSLLDEIPLEDLDLHAETWTVERLRAAEARLAASGSRHLTVAALSPDGRVVGLSGVSVRDAAPELGEIGITVVAPGHRGHRLGLAMKARLHREVAERFPDVVSVVTYNAGVNDHMNDINARLGYRVRQHVVAVQKRV